MLSKSDKTKILNNAQTWFKDTIMSNHLKNTKKLSHVNEFNINPFLAVYLANFLTGHNTPEDIARSLILPRVLGQSITTSFGQNLQSFISQVLGAFGSTTSGIDIEFIDQIDQRKKYCQLKLGPNTINKDDIDTIANHFKAIIQLSKTNHLKIPRDDLIVGILYGSPHNLSNHYQKIESQHDFPVIIGQEFWWRLTGDKGFYQDLIKSIKTVSQSADFQTELNVVIKQLASTPQIQALAKS